jgi:hypothetical protein
VFKFITIYEKFIFIFKSEENFSLVYIFQSNSFQNCWTTKVLPIKHFLFMTYISKTVSKIKNLKIVNRIFWSYIFKVRNASVLKHSKIEGIRRRSITAPEINFEPNIQLIPYDFNESAEKNFGSKKMSKCLSHMREREREVFVKLNSHCFLSLFIL